MKVQLVVVRGKPEGKVIPLVGPNFKIGRGETCHLRPNSEQVSREHAEFTIGADSVMRPRSGQSQRDPGQRQGADGGMPAEGPRPGPGGSADLRRLDLGGAAPAAKVAAAPPAAAAVTGEGVRPTTSPATRSTRGCSARAQAPPPRGRPFTAATRSRSPPSRTPSPPPSKPQPPPSASDDEYERQADGRGRAGGRGRRDRRQPPAGGTTPTRKAETKPMRTSPTRKPPGGVHRRVQPVLRRQEGPEGAGQADRPRQAVLHGHQRRGGRHPPQADGTPAGAKSS